ncbi:TolC family protein [Mucilaginibacter paludis]|uniref:Outer membrane efflux protein n=1 Tax=Mucilaginibacter paludis DSM 18603 TaxID=714943 RepID=H1Y627_9SPHI|nr:TolC family protein [Mucilaginibacter paludis]EHQ30986.1 outer membrane efflux protein [Mucilaginibacter paludis DSM 18603]
MLLKTILLLCFFGIWLHKPLKAQVSAGTIRAVKWDLQTCIAYAKKNNTQINSLRLSQLTSQQEYLLARAARLPDLSGSASQYLAHGNDYSNNGTGGSGFTSSGSYGLSSSVTLYNGNYVNNNIQQKDLYVQSANLNIIQQENDITLQITQAYLTILVDKENIIYNTDLVNTSKAQVALAQKKYNAESVARKDLIQLQAQQAADQYTLVNSRNAERGDLLTLKQILMLNSGVRFDIIKPESIQFSDSVTSFQDVEQFALKTRPEVQNGQLNVHIAELETAKARAGYKPSLSGGAALNSGYNSGQEAGYSGQLKNNFNQQVGLTLTIPIFNKRVVKTQVEEAKIAVTQARLDLSNTQIVLSQAVERAYINVENAISQYMAAQEGYQYSKESYRIATELLRVGAANTVDFLLQKNLFVQAQQTFIQARYNQLLSRKIYDFYRGIPITL